MTATAMAQTLDQPKTIADYIQEDIKRPEHRYLGTTLVRLITSGRLPEEATRMGDNERIKRFIAKYTINAARTFGIDDYVGSLEPGKMANYIAPPRRGINHQPIDFEYVRTDV